MAPTPKLNEVQLTVLRWVADGSPAGVMDGYGYRISAAALRTRGLIKLSGRSATWQARITRAGELALGMELEDGGTVLTGRHGATPARKPTIRARSRPLPRSAAPGDLRGAHPLLRATRDAAVGVRPGGDGCIRIGPRRGVAYMEVSRPQLRRAMLVLHGLTKEALSRGWELVPYPEDGDGRRRGIAIKVRDHAYPVEVNELTEPLPLSREEIIAWRRWTHLDYDGRLSEAPPPSMRRRRPTGRLRLVLPHGYHGGRTTWSEGPRGPLELKLTSVLRTLELRAEADEAAEIESARRFAELRREQEARQERARRELIEAARLERLRAEVTLWRESEEVRANAAALEGRLHGLNVEEQVWIRRWCEWAREQADRTDPSRHTSLIAGLDDDG
jgi:hypothetical protein